MIKKILRRARDEDSKGDGIVWNPQLALLAARTAGPLSEEEMIRAWDIIKTGGHLSWEWTYRLMLAVDPTTSDRAPGDPVP